MWCPAPPVVVGQLSLLPVDFGFAKVFFGLAGVEGLDVVFGVAVVLGEAVVFGLGCVVVLGLGACVVCVGAAGGGV